MAVALVLVVAAQSAGSGSPTWVVILVAVIGVIGGAIAGWIARTAAIGSARIAASVEERKLAHEQDKYADARRDKAAEDFFAARDAMSVVKESEATADARRAEALKAKKALLSVRLTFGRPIGGPRFDELLAMLEPVDTERDLDIAAGLWPDVESAILNDPPQKREGAPKKGRFALRRSR
jgi:hypothetical protein